MRLRGSQWPLRWLGVLFGLVLCLLGVLAYFVPGARLPELGEERAAGFGITLMVVGSIAILGSSCRKPPRWRMLRGQRTDWGKWWRP
jgi:uncharacterized membrane protein HdeD (DUF308 family)